VTRDDLALAVEFWRQRLTPEWRVVLMDTLPPDHDGDCWATSQTAVDYTRISIHFTDECLSRDDAEVHVTIAHELLHALTRPWRTTMDRVFPYLPRAAFEQLDRERVHEEEKLVDRLSRLLVTLTPGGRVGTTAVGPGTVNGPPWAEST
jgi:hypothetical protein